MEIAEIGEYVNTIVLTYGMKQEGDLNGFAILDPKSLIRLDLQCLWFIM